MALTPKRLLGQTNPSPARKPSPSPTRARRTPILLEMAWLVFLVWIYDWLEDLAPLRRRLAFAHAEALISFEQRTGLDPERALDHWLARQHVLAFLASIFYSNAIFLVTFIFAVVVWWWRPDLYRYLRNDLVLTNLIAFAVFWLYPVAPPRLLPGFIDVVQKAGGLGAWHDDLIRYADQFAAMPSMHLGYAAWCSLAAWRLARGRYGKRRAAVFGTAYPVLTALVVMATGNHYLLDVLAGVGTLAVAVLFVEAVPGWAKRLRGSTPAGVTERGDEQDPAGVRRSTEDTTGAPI